MVELTKAERWNGTLPTVRETRGDGMARAGRKRKSGERYHNGDLKPAGPAPPSPTALKRIMTDIVKSAHAVEFGSEAGRLCFCGLITPRQLAAANKMADLYGRFERLEGVRRSAASPSYFLGGGGSTEYAAERMTAGQLAERDLGAASVRQSFLSMQGQIPEYPRELRNAVEALAVDGRHINPMQLGDVCWLLDRLAAHWRLPGTGEAPEKGRRHREVMDRPAKAAPGKSQARRDDERAAIESAVRKLRPDLDDDGVRAALDYTTALVERAALRRRRAAAA